MCLDCRIFAVRHENAALPPATHALQPVLSRPHANLNLVPSSVAIAGDPRQPAHLRARLRLAAFSSAVVLCDVAWTDPDPYDGVDEIDRCNCVLLLSDDELGQAYRLLLGLCSARSSDQSAWCTLQAVGCAAAGQPHHDGAAQHPEAAAGGWQPARWQSVIMHFWLRRNRTLGRNSMLRLWPPSEQSSLHVDVL